MSMKNELTQKSRQHIVKMYLGCNCNAKEKVTRVAEWKTRLPESSIHARQGGRNGREKFPGGINRLDW